VFSWIPFREAWAFDFEYIASPGNRPDVVCLVAKELRSGRQIHLWRDQLTERSPFPIDKDVLFLAYFASADLGCFLELGWPLPRRIIDLFAEFRVRTNGLPLPDGRGLLGALTYHHVPGITSDEKRAGRDLVLRGPPWSDAERRDVLDYCQTDVDVLGPLLERMWPHITATEQGLGQALLRGRYTAAVARMEHAGVPVDVHRLQLIRSHWADLKLKLIAEIDADYGVYEGTSFRSGLFASWLQEHGVVDWPRDPHGRLLLDKDTFKEETELHPELLPLKELRKCLSGFRLERLAIGADGRNRTMLSPFGATSGRNTPSATQFVFGLSKWLRSLVKPAEGQAIAYLDWSCQEVGLAAGLSGDERLADDVRAGDPYIAFAVKAGLAPPGATKLTHDRARSVCKTLVLGVNYGMGVRTFAHRAEVCEVEAARLLRMLVATYPKFWRWSKEVVDSALLSGLIRTVFGWPMHVTGSTSSRTLKNFPMQANGAEMLRLACCLATERGVQVCAPVHDALLIEASCDEIDDAVATARAAMAQASVVLGGMELRTDVAITRWPYRYSDPAGVAMWDRVSTLLAGAK
jgi:hypothetical protein